MLKFVKIIATSLFISGIATAAFAHGGGSGGGGGARVEAWQKAHPAICKQDGDKLVLIANPKKPCSNQ